MIEWQREGKNWYLQDDIATFILHALEPNVVQFCNGTYSALAGHILLAELSDKLSFSNFSLGSPACAGLSALCGVCIHLDPYYLLGSAYCAHISLRSAGFESFLINGCR